MLKNLRRLARRFGLWNPRMAKGDHKAFWVGDGLRNILPKGSEGDPAGWDERAFLKQWTGAIPFETAWELGCGYGRLATAFDAKQYVGVDLNPKAVERARQDNPGYTFREIDFDDAYPQGDLCLAYTVLLHIHDDYIHDVAARIAAGSRSVLVVEILGRRRRGGGKTPSFNRERGEYEQIFSAFELAWELRKPYLFYRDTDISFLYFQKPPLRQAQGKQAEAPAP